MKLKITEEKRKSTKSENCSKHVYYFQNLLRFHCLVWEEVGQECVADKEAEIQRAERLHQFSQTAFNVAISRGARGHGRAAPEALGDAWGRWGRGVWDRSLVTLATGG